MSMQLRFWGVRGSVPSPGPSTASVGGNTSCVEVTCNGHTIILDAGTGIRGLGNRLAERTGLDVAVMFSHVHWDHIQGLPFFTPLFRPDTTMRLYGAPEEAPLDQLLRRQMSSPMFPVGLDQVPAALRFEAVTVGRPFAVGPMTVTAAPLNHPNGALSYRIECNGRSIVYATDTEHDPGGAIDARLVAHARDADVLIYDSQYTPEEYTGVNGFSRVGWGHSTWTEAIRVTRAAGVEQLVLFHHDPTRDDDTVAAIEEAAREQHANTVAAREGLEIELDSSEVDQAAA